MMAAETYLWVQVREIRFYFSSVFLPKKGCFKYRKEFSLKNLYQKDVTQKLIQVLDIRRGKKNIKKKKRKMKN